MRIAIDMRRMHNTGIGRYARNIFAAVAAEAPQHEYTAVVQSEAHGAEILALAPSARYHVAPAEQFTAREMLRTPDLGHPIDIWHSPHPFQWAIGGRHRVVLTLLDLTQVTHAIGTRNLLFREPIRAFIWAACRRADGFVAISGATRDAFTAMMGVPAARMHVTHLAPDPRFVPPPGPDAVTTARRRLGLPERVLLYVGMSQPHKNLDRLLQAMGILARERPLESLSLAIIGPNVPTERASLLERIEALGIRDRVHFLNWLSDEEVQLAYWAAEVLVHPSLSEGFGLTVLEAMRSGTPCVVSDIPVLREVAGDAAEFADPFEPASIARAIRTVLDDRARSADLRARGLVHAQRFSWRMAARATLAAYEATLQDSHRSRARSVG